MPCPYNYLTVEVGQPCRLGWRRRDNQRSRPRSYPAFYSALLSPVLPAAALGLKDDGLARFARHLAAVFPGAAVRQQAKGVESRANILLVEFRLLRHRREYRLYLLGDARLALLRLQLTRMEQV